MARNTRFFAKLIPLVLFLLLALAPCALARQAKPQYLKMSKSTLTLSLTAAQAQTHQLSVTIKPDEATDAPVAWRSADESVARVDENGLVTPVGRGTVKIYAAVEGASQPLEVACKVRVSSPKLSEIMMQPDAVLVDMGSGSKSAQLTLRAKPVNAPIGPVTWESSDPSVCTVDENGVVTGLRNGTCTVTAAADDGKKRAKCTVTCLDKSKMLSLVYTAGGDLVLGGDSKKDSDKRFDQIIRDENGNPDYGYVLRRLKPLFEKDDFTYVNLECPLKGGRQTSRGRQFYMHGKPEYVNILVQGDVEVANIVNNHMNDFGTKDDTIQILQNAGICVADKTPNIFTFNGIRVGFIGFGTPENIERVHNQTLRASEMCDVLVVTFHWSNMKEYKHTLWPIQVKLAREAVNCGADVILAHHVHVPSGIQIYKGVYIYYGLGALESSGWRFGRKDMYNTFVTQQKIYFDPDTKFVYSEIPTIYPVCPSSAPLKAPNNCQPMLLPTSDYRYEYPFKVIEKNSGTSGGTIAPYKKGVFVP